MRSLTKIPSGVQYFFDDEAKLRRHIERQITEVFSGWSYDEIILPIFDYHDLFARGMGREQAERTYRFVDREGAMLALRPELTSLVARTVATRFVKRARPIRLYYSGEVFRYDEPTEKASREFHQIGIEHVGEAGIAADLEILLVAAEALEAIGIPDFRIALSHVDFFNGFAADMNLTESDRAEFRELVDRRNSESLAQFLKKHAPAMSESTRRSFCELTQAPGEKEALELARSMPLNEISKRGLGRLEEIHSTLSKLGLVHHFDLDLGEAGELEYYTGLTFKVFIEGSGSEIGGGGRYDNLIANFGGSEPAVGFSLSLDALVSAIKQRAPDGRAAEQITERVIVIENGLDAGFEEARRVRAAGERVRIGRKSN